MSYQSSSGKRSNEARRSEILTRVDKALREKYSLRLGQPQPAPKPHFALHVSYMSNWWWVERVSSRPGVGLGCPTSKRAIYEATEEWA